MVGLRVPAQQVGEVEQLRKQLQEMKAAFEAAQKLQREQIEALQKQLDAMQRQPTAAPPAAAAPVTVSTVEPQKDWKPGDPPELDDPVDLEDEDADEKTDSE